MQLLSQSASVLYKARCLCINSIAWLNQKTFPSCTRECIFCSPPQTHTLSHKPNSIFILTLFLCILGSMFLLFTFSASLLVSWLVEGMGYQSCFPHCFSLKAHYHQVAEQNSPYLLPCPPGLRKTDKHVTKVTGVHFQNFTVTHIYIELISKLEFTKYTDDVKKTDVLNITASSKCTWQCLIVTAQRQERS